MRLSSPHLLLAAVALGCGADAPAHRAPPAAPAGAPPAAQRAVAAQPLRPAPADTPTIVVDPGHPSETSGGTVQHGVAEVHVAWLVALRLRDHLQRAGYRVMLTKQRENELVRNADRAGIANRAGAALMVRLHCDATNGSGFTLYYPNRQGTVSGVTGPSEAVMRRSRAAAEALHRGMAPVIGTRLRDGGIRGDADTFVGARQGALTGSIFSRVPVVTIEMVVLGAQSDADFITSAAGQELMARAIAAGVDQVVASTRTSPARDSATVPRSDSVQPRNTARATKA
jgi:N-acetylmuramoyl-L-alanine amidase